MEAEKARDASDLAWESGRVASLVCGAVAGGAEWVDGDEFQQRLALYRSACGRRRGVGGRR